MGQSSDALTVALTGQLAFMLMVSAALTFPVAFALISLYRHAVLKSMRATGSNAGPPPLETPQKVQPPPLPAIKQAELHILDAVDEVLRNPAADRLSLEAWHAPWRAAVLYGAAGLGYAAVMAVAFLTAGRIEFLPVRFLVLLWIYTWPVVLAVNLVAVSTRRAKLATASAYFLIFALLNAIAMAKSPALTAGQSAFLWLSTNLPATILLLASLHRRIRAVGPMVLAFICFAVTGSLVVISLLSSNDALLGSISGSLFSVGLNARGAYAVLNVAGLVLFAPLGWLAVQWVRSRYERKKISDESLTLDAIWLLFGVVQSMGLVFEHPAWILSGLVGFSVYKIIVSSLFWFGAAKKRATQSNLKLLLLRVFSLGKRSERLFDAIGKHWRRVGSIQMIVGPDLATTTVEPHEFLDFVRGRLARRFIDNTQALDLRLGEMDLLPDRDRRFRVNDFFCREHMWKMALCRLVGQSNVVLMDLRGFSPQSAGCIFEIDQLINVVPVDRVVFVIDKTTNELFLRQTLQRVWNRMPLDSPNCQAASAELRVFRLFGRHAGQLRQLLEVLCTAARSGSVGGVGVRAVP